jgi:aminoglycoside/choline kinase family phosphotransferase
VEPVRIWERSCVLRMRTASGFVYLKAIPPGISHEVSVTQALAKEYPERLPSVIAADPERRFLLMNEITGALLSTVGEIGTWEKALREYAQMQIEYSSRTDELLATGCPDSRFQSLMTHAEALLEDTSAMLMGQQMGLDEEEVKRLRAMLPNLKALCERLDSFPVPYSLVHGDLWSQNIVWTGAGFVYFDWSDAALSHPFIDMALFLDIGQELPEVPNARGILRNAYLEPWERFERPERLMEILTLVRPLAWLAKAVFHHQFLLPQMEDGAKWELANVVPYWLKMLLNESD